MAMLEKEIENSLIAQLEKGIYNGCEQWKYRHDINTEAKLWANFKDKLELNNGKVLNGVMLTDVEMTRIKEFIEQNSLTPYKAAKWLSGENGIVNIPLVREDASLGRIDLMAVNQRDIAGGCSSYEVINQFVSDKCDDRDRERRFDVTLLINGMPMIQIELKNQAHGLMDAFRQIVKYSEEGKFRGLFGLVQMFVVSNGVDTKYIAADTADKLNEKFLSGWVNEKNKPVTDYIQFARDVLSIPAAHCLVGKYRVLDNEKKRIILLRPYQIHAIEKVREASKQSKSGYVWHTTGSGKTLTSYTVTKNLFDIPSIDKAIFLIDRKDLDEQTSMAFMSYADNGDMKVDGTDNVSDLRKKLLNTDRQAIVTTVQKLQRLIKFNEEDTDKKDEDGNTIKKLKEGKLLKKLQDCRIAFVVDECHRSVSPQAKFELEKYFINSLWFGFTGTPRFKENKYQRYGDRPRTTDMLYRNDRYTPTVNLDGTETNLTSCLHYYTVKEAIHDNAVLGFNIEYDTTIDFENQAADLDVKIPDGYDNTNIKQRMALEEDFLKAYKLKNQTQSIADIYDTDKHRNEVIDRIINRSQGKFGLRNGEGCTYEGILSVSSIKIAQRYYELFKEFIASDKVSKSVKQYLPDFPKIAITYSVGENEDGALANQDMMKKSLEDYNQMFSKHFTLEDGLRSYNADLNARLSRKKGIYLQRKEQLDLVIVVDRLLTGFDAPCLDVLFLDRPPMQPHEIIQAFSRTNRLFDKNKLHGQIVTFQTPAKFEHAVQEALRLFSHGGEKDVLAPTFIEMQAIFKDKYNELMRIAPTPESLAELTTIDEQKQFVRAFAGFDRALSEIRVYSEWDDNRLKTDFPLFADDDDVVESDNEDATIDNIIDPSSEDTEDNLIDDENLMLSAPKLKKSSLWDKYAGNYHNFVENIKKEKKKESNIVVDLDYELQTVNKAVVNYKYLISLIQAYMPSYDDNEDRGAINTVEIEKYIDTLAKDNPKLGGIILTFWKHLKANPELYKGKQAIEVIDQCVEKAIDDEVSAFAKKWFLSKDELKYFARQTSIDAASLTTLTNDFDAYKANGGELSKLRYRSTIKTETRKLIEEEIKPLLRR